MPALGKSGTLRIFALSVSMFLSCHTKSREAAGCLDIQRLDLVYASAGGPSPHGHLEPLHRSGIAFRSNFNGPVMLIADVTLNAFALRGVLDEESKPHALHTSLDDVATPDEHGELYRGTCGGSIATFSIDDCQFQSTIVNFNRQLSIENVAM